MRAEAGGAIIDTWSYPIPRRPRRRRPGRQRLGPRRRPHSASRPEPCVPCARCTCRATTSRHRSGLRSAAASPRRTTPLAPKRRRSSATALGVTIRERPKHHRPPITVNRTERHHRRRGAGGVPRTRPGLNEDLSAVAAALAPPAPEPGREHALERDSNWVASSPASTPRTTVPQADAAVQSVGPPSPHSTHDEPREGGGVEAYSPPEHGCGRKWPTRARSSTGSR